MGRPALFNKQEVLRSALDTFWKHGFDKASFSDLEKSTGVKKMTLFREFGDKEDLFLAALDEYHKETVIHFEKALSLEPPLRSIEAFLDRPIEMATGNRCTYGCFHINSIVEQVTHNERVAKKIKVQQMKIRKLLITVLAKGQSDKSIRSDLSAGELADYLLCSIYGIVVGGKSRVSRASMKATKKVIIDAIAR